MHSAPAVRYPVPRSPLAGRWLLALCAVSGGAAGIGWQAGLSAPGLALVVLVWLMAVAVCWAQWRSLVPGQLRWDGQAWWWRADQAPSGDECPVRVAVHLDLQSAMLLHLQGVGRTAPWCWLDASAAPVNWQAMRRALCQPQAEPELTQVSLP
jgi:hypothetical protein